MSGINRNMRIASFKCVYNRLQLLHVLQVCTFDPYTQSLVPTSHCLLLCTGCFHTGAAQLSSVPSLELHSGVGSSPFSASKPPTIVCRARNEPTQRRIKPGSSQPTVPLTPNCPLSLVCVFACVCVGMIRQTAAIKSPHQHSHCWQLSACASDSDAWRHVEYLQTV